MRSTLAERGLEQLAACLGGLATLDIYERDDVLGHLEALEALAHEYLDPLWAAAWLRERVRFVDRS